MQELKYVVIIISEMHELNIMIKHKLLRNKFYRRSASLYKEVQNITENS
jgi:hypothetical protein